jgi:hypothetical protein
LLGHRFRLSGAGSRLDPFLGLPRPEEAGYAIRLKRLARLAHSAPIARRMAHPP